MVADLKKAYNSQQPRRPERKSTVKTYVASIGGKTVLAFRAEDDDKALAMIDDQAGGIRSDLKALVSEDGKPLWDGKSAIQAQEATAAQRAEWEQSRDQAISDEEIDLDAGDDPDEWSVYLASAAQMK
jgi:hypothetical protein